MKANESLTPGTFVGALVIALFSVTQGFFVSYVGHDSNKTFAYCMVLYGPLILTLTYVAIIESFHYFGIPLGSPDHPVLSLDSVLTVVFSVGGPYIIGLGYYVLSLFVIQ